MLNAVFGLCCVLVAVSVAFYLPLALTASTSAAGVLWWLFSSYRNVLEDRRMSGSMANVIASKSGLLDGYAPCQYSLGNGTAQMGRSTLNDSGRANRSAGRFNDFSDFVSSPLSPNTSFKVSLRPQKDESPILSPSVSSMSRSWTKENKPYSNENRTTLPHLAPGSYPWIVNHNRSSEMDKSGIGVVPVKIRLSKPSSSFVVPPPEVPNKEHLKADPSKQIIQALKNMSRKRMHMTESDDSAEISPGPNVPKRRPKEFYHNLYASHLAGSEECSFQSHQETSEDVLDHGATSAESLPASQSLGSSVELLPTVPKPANQAPPPTNKRPRPANDSGSQTAKKRNNNEILCSLSSSLGILDPQLLQGSQKRKDTEKDASSKKQKLKETSCVEVQTLPSPNKDDKSKEKEDKCTATDKEAEDLGQERTRRKSVVAEKRVTENMAAALLKSAMIKFATSGELVSPDTSNKGNGEVSGAKLNESVSASEIAVTVSTAPITTTIANSSHGLFQFGAPSTAEVTATTATVTSPNATQSFSQSSQPSGLPLGGFPKPQGTEGFKFGSDTVHKADSSKNDANPVSKPSFTFGAPSGGFSVASTSAPSVSVPSVAPNTAGSGLNLQAPAATTVTFGQGSQPATTAPLGGSNPATTTTITFGSTQSTSNPQTSTPTITFGQSAPQSTANLQGASAPIITFGQAPTVSTDSTAPTITFGAVSKHSGGVTFSQSLQTPQKAPSTSSNGGFCFTPSKAFSIGSSSTSTATTTATGQQTSSKPGGFSFTPSTAFSMGSSPTSSTASTSSAPIFSFGSSGFGQKPDATKTLFGMPPPPATSAPTATASEPTKSFGGFSFTPASNDGAKPLFPSAVPQNPEQKKPEAGFSFGNATSQGKPFSFDSGAVTTESPVPRPSFQFGGSSATTAPPAFGSNSNSNVFSSPAATSSGPFGSTSLTTTAFGSTTPKTTGFGAPTTTVANFGTPSAGFGTAPTFGSVASSQPPTFGTPSAPTPAFGAATTQATTLFGATPTGGFGTTTTAAPSFGSTTSTFKSTPAFGSSGLAFGSSAPAFGSGSAAFGSAAPVFGSGSTSTFGATQPTFGSAASSSAPTPSFNAATTTTPQFSSGFGSAFTTTSAAPSFGASTSSAVPATPSFGGGAPPNSAPFSFSAPSTGGFNFTAPQPSAPSNMFQFGSSTSTAPPAGGQQPFAFGAPATPASGGFQNTMFSIGSGTAAPRRSASSMRTRKK